MAVKKPLELHWDGKTYKVTMTMDLIDEIDEAVNLVRFVAEMRSGEVYLAKKVSKLFTIVLNAGGGDFDRHEVFSALFGDGTATQAEIQIMTAAIMSAIFPEPKKKTLAGSKTKAPAKRKRKTA